MPVQIARITEVIRETPRITTLRFDLEMKAAPNQYVMVWIPGVDEKPLSLSYIGEKCGVTALAQGPFTKSFCERKVGDMVGLRGPYGRGFKIAGERLLLVGGGVGMVPLTVLAEKARERGKEVTAVIGARTKTEVLFADRIKAAGGEVLVATDDGTEGTKGFTTDVLRDLLKTRAFDQAYTCGPEVMMLKVIEQTVGKGIQTQVSMERYFKCGGIGICGHCVLDDLGYRVCVEGPTFMAEEVLNKSFGKYRRDASGSRVYFGVKK
ncbi:MAG: dihydroorotate dehydrogenase electron transfer subunit [Candidatus Hydrothermarchaeota archaeon]